MIDESRLTRRIVTERARKLRAQYALQAQGLRSRLEMRVNRIPQALRKRNIQDLIDEHAAKNNPKPAAPVPVTEKQAERAAPPSVRKSLKRSRYVLSCTAACDLEMANRA